MANCAQHPEVAALYQCDGCQQPLCGECIQESHALLLCRLCGERALPLHRETPATPGELHKESARSAPYGFKEAISYPFRGTGVYLFIGTLAAYFACWVLSFFCVGFIAYMLLSLLIVGLQFKIVRSTADGENELPDWPDFSDFGGLVADYITWIAISLLQFAPVALYMLSRADQTFEAFAAKPDPMVWLAIAALTWVGTAVALIGFGAAGNYRHRKAIAVHLHLRAFLGTLPQSVHITNYGYALFMATTFLQSFFQSTIPLLGGVLSGVVGVYWVYMMPHLGGLLFRRHSHLMDRLYWPERGNLA